MICDRTIHPSKYTSFPRDPMVLNNNNNNSTLKMQRCREYMKALESEKRKIQVFQRELPLCLELVTQAIEGCKQQMCGTTTDYFNGQSDCSEQTSSDGPVLEEFIPVKSNLCVDDEEEEDHDDDGQEKAQLYDTSKISCSKLDKSSFKKLDWLRSAQLSIQTPDPVDLSPKRVPVVEVKRNGCGAFHPFKKENCSGSASATQVVKISSDQMADASSTAETGSGGDVGSKSDDKGQSNRKTRRCWSPELHRRFLHALQQLGGSHVATPKQIRELMKVDGLTNDEVKSHLQKYRLHTRRPNSTIDNNQQTPQFVVVGGLWMPPPEYATMAGNSTQTSGDTNNPKGVYAPIASHPPPMAEASMSINKNDSSDKDDGNSHNDSPSTSSSTHTTTNSPAF